MAGSYTPSIPAAVIFALAFGVALCTHVYQAIRKKTRFMLPVIIATAMEVTGYVFRVIRVNEHKSIWPAVISETMLVTAPAIFIAQNYMVVGRMIAYAGGNLSIIRDTWITKIFVCADVITILTQILGITILTSAEDLAQVYRGKNILLTGLALQVITFAVFIVVTVHFDWKTRKVLGTTTMLPLRPLFKAMYVTGFLVLARSIFRTVEFGTLTFGQGKQSGYLITHEWPLYALDSTPTLISTLILSYIHPGNYLPARKGQRLDGTYDQPQARRGWLRLNPRTHGSPLSSHDNTV